VHQFGDQPRLYYDARSTYQQDEQFQQFVSVMLSMIKWIIIRIICLYFLL